MIRQCDLLIVAALLLSASIVSDVAGSDDQATSTGDLILEDDFERDEPEPDKEQIGNGWTSNSAWRAGGHKQVDLEADRWYTLRVDVEGDVMRASVDGKSIGQFKSAGIAHPTKRMITLAVNKSAWVDDVKVWRKK